MTVGDASSRLGVSHILYKVGSTYIVKSSATGLTTHENTSLSTVLEALKTLNGDNGNSIGWERADYVMDATVTYDSTHKVKHIGLGDWFRTTITPGSDITCFKFDGALHCQVENFLFANSASTFTSPFIEMTDVCQFNLFKDLYMNNSNGGHKGYGFKFTLNTTGQHCFNKFDTVITRNLVDGYRLDSTGSSTNGVWSNSNLWFNCVGYDSDTFVKLIQRGGSTVQQGHFDANMFTNCHWQSGATGPVIAFDFDNGGAGLVDVMMTGNIIWDLPASSYSMSVNQYTTVNSVGNVNLDKNITGSGIGTTGFKLSRDWQTELEGVASFSGTGSQTDFTITHNLGLTPTIVHITPLSRDAMGEYHVTSITTTQMTVRYKRPPRAANPSANITLSWKVRKGI